MDYHTYDPHAVTLTKPSGLWLKCVLDRMSSVMTAVLRPDLAVLRMLAVCFGNEPISMWSRVI